MGIRKCKDGRSWAVYDDSGVLVVVALYRRDAEEVSRCLSLAPSEHCAPKGPRLTRPRSPIGQRRLRDSLDGGYDAPMSSPDSDLDA